jgi:hypothetical protein
LDGLKVAGRTWFNYARLLQTLFRFAQKKHYYPRNVDPFESRAKWSHALLRISCSLIRAKSDPVRPSRSKPPTFEAARPGASAGKGKEGLAGFYPISHGSFGCGGFLHGRSVDGRGLHYLLRSQNWRTSVATCPVTCPVAWRIRSLASLTNAGWRRKRTTK